MNYRRYTGNHQLDWDASYPHHPLFKQVVREYARDACSISEDEYSPSDEDDIVVHVLGDDWDEFLSMYSRQNLWCYTKERISPSNTWKLLVNRFNQRMTVSDTQLDVVLWI